MFNNQNLLNTQINRNQQNLNNAQNSQNNINIDNFKSKTVITQKSNTMRNMNFVDPFKNNNHNYNYQNNNYGNNNYFNNKNNNNFSQQKNQQFQNNYQIQNNQFNRMNSQQQMINNNYQQNQNKNNSINNECLKTNIYFFQDKNNFIRYGAFFENSQNIYSLGQKYNNINMNNQFNNNNTNNERNYNQNQNNMYNNMNNQGNYNQNNMNSNMNNRMINSMNNIKLNGNNINNQNNNINNNNNVKNNNFHNNNMENNLNYNTNNNNSNNNMAKNSNNINSNNNNINNKADNSNFLNNNTNNINNKASELNNNTNISRNSNYSMNNNNTNSSYSTFDMNEVKKEISGFGPYKCSKCSISHTGLKNLKNICQKCFIIDLITQSKIIYKDYLKNVTSSKGINSITKEDFNNLFINKIFINYDNKKYNIYEAIDEFNTPENKDFNINNILNDIILELRQDVCLYCFNNVQCLEFKLPCGCNFCSYNHLELFVNEKLKNKLNINYKCFCSYEYKPNKILELSYFLKNKKIYKDYNYLIKRLNELFGGICFKCGKEKKDMTGVEIEGFCPINFNHFMCDDCIENESSNYVKCSICNIQHKYLLNDF